MGTDLRLTLARQLVAALEANRSAEADAVAAQLGEAHPPQLLHELVELTREVHRAFGGLVSDPKLLELTKHSMPDARARLSYVIEKTEEAAHRTLAAVEAMSPVAAQLNASARAFTAALDIGDPRMVELARRFVDEVGAAGERLRVGLDEVLMAQEYQDLTGQVIKRTIEIVTQVEQKLVAILTQEHLGVIGAPAAPGATEAQGPAIAAAPHVMSRQTEVDDLLAELGV